MGRSLREKRVLFLLSVALLYAALFVWRDCLQGPPQWDEVSFWQTSLTFSDRLIPTLDQLRNYEELNTPLPFVLFGMLEYLFHQGCLRADYSISCCRSAWF